MVRECTQVHVNALFGNTDYADGVPDARSTDHAGDDEGNLPEDNPPAKSRTCRPLESLAEGLSPAAGPVYLEGRLVLSLSFQPLDGQIEWLGELARHLAECNASRSWMGDPLERFRIWDDSTGAWFTGGPTVLRFENADVVKYGEDESAPVWIGAVDTRKRVIPVPDFGRAGAAENQLHDLRWKRC
ncbi:MAG: hypothetical protein ACOYIP_01365 [Coriobacteriales bacterium]|jgi:hypothetical protein